MARQLLETRSVAAFAGVEAYAKRHSAAETGGLAWLLLGYAQLTERNPDYKKAITALRKAKPLSRDLGDYIDYYLASALRGSGDERRAAGVLNGVEDRYPDSLLLRDAVVMHAEVLNNLREHKEAVDLLTEHRAPARAEVELTIGRAFLGLGQQERALEAFRNVYYGMPLSAQAPDAGAELRRLTSQAQLATFEKRKTRADLLSKGRSYAQAVTEYQKLLNEAPESSRAELQIALGYAQYKAGRPADAKTTLLTVDPGLTTAEHKARRLYVLAELAREADDDEMEQGYVKEALNEAPESGWTQEALMSMGNEFMLRREFARAILFYDEVARRFPNARGAMAHWRSAWLTYRLEQREAARQRFEAQIKLHPASAEVASALYWLGRLSEEDGETAKARAYYAKLEERFRNYYYAVLARERVSKLGAGEVATEPLLEQIGSANVQDGFLHVADAETSVRYQKSRLLANAALYDLAIAELNRAAAQPENRWALIEIVRLHQESGNAVLALQALKRAMPGYLSQDLEAVPRSLVEALFPRPYWDALARHASENELDPYLVASLIRQESEFDPTAISHANAYGLMQLLPDVGRRMAREINLRSFATAKLLEPQPNLQLGTRYFRQMIDVHGGQVEYALAAYNAGPHRVADWLNQGQGYRDMPEFVESIPFTETREYVQSIVRNMNVYKQLYREESASAGVD